MLRKLLLGSISLLFLVACTEANPTPTPTAAPSPINQERAIGIASTDFLMLPEVVGRAHMTAQLVGDVWEVTFDQVNAHRDELRWPSMGLGPPRIYKTLVLKVDAQIGEVIGRTAVPLAVSDTDVPLPPLKLVAVREAEVIRLVWLDYATNETSYVVERSKSNEPGHWTEMHAPADTTVFVDKEVVQGVAYFYRVKARNNIGDSPYSNVSTATVLPESIYHRGITGKVALRGEQQHGGVTVHASGPGHTSVTESGLDGSFALSGMPPGYYRLRFTKDGFAETRRDALVTEGRFLVLPDVWLFKNGSIRGRVLFTDGQPAEKVAVVRWSLDRGGIKVFTDGEGFFQIPNQEPGWYWVTAAATGYSPKDPQGNRCVQLHVTPGTKTLVDNITLVPSSREEVPSCP